MGDSPQERYMEARRKLDDRRGDAISIADYEAIAEYLDAFDPQAATPAPAGESSKAYNTLQNHAWTLQTVARRLDGRLVDADAADINGLFERLLRGDHPDVKDSGLTQGTVHTTSSVVRAFADFSDEIDAQREDIFQPKKEEAKVDERDMFTSEEMQALRDAAQNARDKALVDMLLYTGQRVRAIQTLRIKDIDLEAGQFYLNTDAAGLKGAEGKRPLLGAKAGLSEWLDLHPCPNDPEAAVFTVTSSATRGEAGEPLARSQINRRLKILGDEAGIDKPVNPHNFRHVFVTVAKRDYGLDDSEVKHLLGHSPDSTVMETTYSHLTDEEVIENVEVKAGYVDPDDSSPLSPPACRVCDEPLPTDARACPKCGTVYTPDARAAKETINEVGRDAAFAADDPEEQAAVEAVTDHIEEQLRENPEEAIDLLRDAGLLGESKDA